MESEIVLPGHQKQWVSMKTRGKSCLDLLWFGRYEGINCMEGIGEISCED